MNDKKVCKDCIKSLSKVCIGKQDPVPEEKPTQFRDEGDEDSIDAGETAEAKAAFAFEEQVDAHLPEETLLTELLSREDKEQWQQSKKHKTEHKL